MISSGSIQTSSRSGSRPSSVRRAGTLFAFVVPGCYSLTYFRIVPNYDLAPDLSQVDILRVVVKENFTEALLDRLVIDLVRLHIPSYHFLGSP